MHALQYGDKSFDLVIHSDTLEHVEPPVRASRSAATCSRPAGRVCFTVPIIVGRLTRGHAGLAKSYHGDPSNSSDDFVVNTEFGADARCFLMQAGSITHVAIKGAAIRMFSHVDPVPGVVVQGRPLDLRRWRRDGVGQGLGPGRS